MINSGKTPVIEEEIGDVISRAVEVGTLRATTDSAVHVCLKTYEH